MVQTLSYIFQVNEEPSLDTKTLSIHDKCTMQHVPPQPVIQSTQTLYTITHAAQCIFQEVEFGGDNIVLGLNIC